MGKYLQAFINGIGSTVLRITTASDLPRYQHHAFRKDAANMRHSIYTATQGLRKRAEVVKNGK